MRKLNVTFKGVDPILLHSCQCVNPLHPISIELKKLTGKRQKTEEDLAKISDLEFMSGLYWDDEVGVYVPAENISRSIEDGAKFMKKGKDIKRHVSILGSSLVPLDYGAKKTLEELCADYSYRDVRAAGVMRARVVRTRPRFHAGWKLNFTISFDENNIDAQTVCQAIDYAGSYVGLCDFRPRYGKFTATVTEI